MEEKTISEGEAIAQILEHTRKTRQYMKWQLIITVALVVIPLVALVVILPLVMHSVSSAYGTGGVEATTGLQDLLK